MTKRARKDYTESESDYFSDSESDFGAQRPSNKQTASRKSAPQKRTVEEIYQKKTQLEHILLRPDSYIGSIEATESTQWVFQAGKIVQKKITYVPGLYKIFDEILVNAADNKQRDASMTRIDVDIDPETKAISVWNNGRGIPIEIHKKENLYVPELIFGHLLTSSNYDDREKKTTGGRNGYGAKLANIFSHKFIVETASRSQGLLYVQEFTDNMYNIHRPTITPCRMLDFTKITFYPDLAKFNMTSLDSDIIALFTKRTYDMAGILPGVSVYLNKEQLPMKTFKDYVEKLYLAPTASPSIPPVSVLPPSAEAATNAAAAAKTTALNEESQGLSSQHPLPTGTASTSTSTSTPETFQGLIHRDVLVHEKRPDIKWEILVTGSSEGSFSQVSFVNAIATTKGGTHVNHIVDQLTARIIEHIQKKNKGISIKAPQAKNQLFVFANCLIENPAFDSQTKENMTLRAKSFGGTFTLSEKFIKAILNDSILMDSVVSIAKFRQDAQLNKAMSASKKARITGIPKLDDANYAGTRRSEECTLILTEGDSAKALAVAGLSVVGRDRYGIFPLRGKLLNVRDAPMSQVAGNAEIQALITIMGLQRGKDYKEVSGLRYGSIMIMTDQDHDGSHIKGLLISFIHHFWPSLLKIKGFITVFITPIVKVFNISASARGPNRVPQEGLSFFTLPEYMAWREHNDASKFRIKYYKGLGTSTAAEAKAYFSDLPKHKKTFEWQSTWDDQRIELVFDRKKADARKEWLQSYIEGTFLDQHTEKNIPFSEFVDKELILFSMADNARSIPSAVDGLKPGQRKILFSAFKKNLVTELKVAQFSGYVAEHSAYHHGEQSLAQTIVGMAQSFVGSNNINLLFPGGQFGTRLYGGKDAASSRYIYTRLTQIARKIFHPDDDALLHYLDDDGLSIEPKYYVPIIPMVLVNGAEGIGTGWSTSIPCFSPWDIINELRLRIKHTRETQQQNQHLGGNGGTNRNGKGDVKMEDDADQDGHAQRTDFTSQELTPYYHGFTGSITKLDRGRYLVKGIMRYTDQDTIEITELPLQTWTQPYKEYLETLRADASGDLFRDIREYHTESTVHFKLTLARDISEAELRKKLRLETNLNTSNMVLFNEESQIKKFETPISIIDNYYPIRLQLYTDRKRHLETVLSDTLHLISEKVRFLRLVIAGQLVISNRKKKEIIVDLKAHGFSTLKPEETAPGQKEVSAEIDEVEDMEEDDNAAAAGAQETDAGKNGGRKSIYDELLGMPLYNLTQEKIEQLEKVAADKRFELECLQKRDATDLWMDDLFALEKELESLKKTVAARMGAGAAGSASKPQAKAKVKTAPPVKKPPPAAAKVAALIAARIAEKSGAKPAAKLAAKSSAKSAPKSAAKPAAVPKISPVKKVTPLHEIPLRERILQKKSEAVSSSPKSAPLVIDISDEPSDLPEPAELVLTPRRTLRRNGTGSAQKKVVVDFTSEEGEEEDAASSASDEEWKEMSD